MVRLKVIKNVWKPAINQISIPYGAIKRDYIGLKKLKDRLISIPYGAIKSYYDSNCEAILEDFNSLWCD